MTSPLNFFRQKPKPLPRDWDWKESLRYWLFWVFVIAALGFAMNRYLEYRNQELKKHLERLY